MSVKRYTSEAISNAYGESGRFIVSPEASDSGWWVLYSDYAALTQRAELAESRVKELSKPVTDEEGKDAGLFDDGMTDGQLRSWMSKVNTQMLELILTTRPLDKPAWYVRLMTEEVQRRRLESRREQ